MVAATAVMEPGYKPPPRPYLTTTCHRLYSLLKESILDIMALPEVYIALTIDLWTNWSVESYLIAMAHYINSKWEPKSNLEMKERHTGKKHSRGTLHCSKSVED